MQQEGGGNTTRSGVEAFSPGAAVVVSLAEPREKYWGVLLSLTVAGVSVRGILLDAFDDFASQIRAGERVIPAVLFFPMHRLERIELDARSGELQSMAERFESKSGASVASIFYAAESRR
jgi:hypothetical protein